jgi:TldD protein
MGGVPRNARAQGIDRPVVRMSNTYIQPADRSVWRKDLNALIADVKFGVMLIGTLGGAVSRKRGSTGASGWRI